MKTSRYEKLRLASCWALRCKSWVPRWKTLSSVYQPECPSLPCLDWLWTGRSAGDLLWQHLSCLCRIPACMQVSVIPRSQEVTLENGLFVWRIPAVCLPILMLDPPGTCFVHISTVHAGAFVLIVSEIILAPESPMWFPWRLICWIPWFPDSAVAMHITPSIPKEFSWRLSLRRLELTFRAFARALAPATPIAFPLKL